MVIGIISIVLALASAAYTIASTESAESDAMAAQGQAYTQSLKNRQKALNQKAIDNKIDKRELALVDKQQDYAQSQMKKNYAKSESDLLKQEAEANDSAILKSAEVLRGMPNENLSSGLNRAERWKM